VELSCETAGKHFGEEGLAEFTQLQVINMAR
jgi:hypothetical protein